MEDRHALNFLIPQGKVKYRNHKNWNKKGKLLLMNSKEISRKVITYLLNGTTALKEL